MKRVTLIYLVVLIGIFMATAALAAADKAAIQKQVDEIGVAIDGGENSKRRTRLGTGSDLDVVEAEAGVSRRQQELLRSEQDVVEAEGRLFEAIGVRPGEAGWTGDRVLVPTDTPNVEPVTVDLDAQLALARARRAAVLAARGLVVAETAELEVTEDRRRAALDLVAAARTVGFAGTLATTPATAGFTPDPAYTGGIGTALGNIGRDVHLYLGLRFEIPLGDHEADVRHTI